MKKRILLLYTGGTIGMMRDLETNALQPFPFHDIYKQLPMLELLDASVEYKELEPLIDSSDTDPAFWIRLAKEIYEEYESFDGFVVLHGTDTMAYTASAISFLLEDLAKPVVFTGSQLPLGVMRTDGRENILNSVEIASAYKNGLPRVPEVCIYFENALFRGNRSYKNNAEQFNAFISSNYPKLAEVGIHVKYNDNFICKPSGKALKIHTKMNRHIGILKLYPGISPQFVSAVFQTPGIRGVIMESYGSGNAPTNPAFLSILEEAVARNIVIVNVTQCKGGGGVVQGEYETSLPLKDMGVVSGYDITTEAAVAKLMYLLGEELSHEEVKHWMQIPLRGELSN